MKRPLWHVLIIIMTSSLHVMAQQDSSFVSTAYQNAISLYPPIDAYQSPLYNGSEYKEPEQTENSHPFYEVDDWQPATIRYDGVLFENADAMYDLFSDALVVEHRNGSPLKLVNAKVSSFTMTNRTFVNISNPDSVGLSKRGFYQVVHNGPTTCLARWDKKRTQLVWQGKIQIWFDLKISYYILKDGVFHNVSSRSNVLQLLKDKKPKLRRYLSSEHLVYRDNKEKTLSKLLSYYDSLTE